MNMLLLTSIALMYGILIGVNIPASFLGISFDDDPSRQRLRFEPPGYVIPAAWFILFTLLGIARYDLLRKDAASLQWLIIGLAILCATYAYYTVGLARLTGVSALWYGLVGNVLVIVVAFFVSYRLRSVSTSAPFLVLPVVIWTTYATAIVIGEMRVQRLI